MRQQLLKLSEDITQSTCLDDPFGTLCTHPNLLLSVICHITGKAFMHVVLGAASCLQLWL